MTKNNESAAERLERLKKEKEAAKVLNRETPLVEQLTHESNGEPDFNAIAEKLEERKKTEAKGENDNHVKLTIYVEESLARSFNALITKRGQQKEFINEAIRDFVQKKIKELGLS